MTYNCMTQPALGNPQGEAKGINIQPHSDLPRLSMGQTQPESRRLGALLTCPLSSAFWGRQQGGEG